MVPSLKTMAVIANGDPYLFEHMMEREGLVIVGRQSENPLDTLTQNESVISIASMLTEWGAHEHTEVTRRQQNLKELAESIGYIVAIEEGMDQQPGTDCDPIKSELRHPKPATPPAPAPPAEGEEGAEGAEEPMPQQ